MVNDIGIQAGARHQKEMPLRVLAFARDQSQRHALLHRIGENCGRAFHGLPDTQFVGQHVGGAGGKNAQRNIGMDHPVDCFVDGAVAARH